MTGMPILTVFGLSVIGHPGFGESDQVLGSRIAPERENDDG
jgi:hypothetical protein